jgi:hypothetical protein
VDTTRTVDAGFGPEGGAEHGVRRRRLHRAEAGASAWSGSMMGRRGQNKTVISRRRLLQPKRDEANQVLFC